MVLTLPCTYFRFERHASAAASRSPLLERMLACADDHAPVVDWRSEAQTLACGPTSPILAPAPAGFLLQVGALAGPQAVDVFIAAPLHTRASLTSVSLPHGGILALTGSEAAELAADFNARLPSVGAARLYAGPAGDLYCTFQGSLSVDTREPDLIQGRDLWDFQPTGPDAGVLKKLGSEVEIFLYDHPVNRRRNERGEPEITALWLWGGGRVAERLPPMNCSFTGADVLFSNWAAVAPVETRARADVPARGLGRIVRCPGAPGTPAFESFARAILAEAAGSLRQGRIEALYLSAGVRCFHVRRMPRWFFRRSRPWWEYFNDDDTDDGADR